MSNFPCSRCYFTPGFCIDIFPKFYIMKIYFWRKNYVIDKLTMALLSPSSIVYINCMQFHYLTLKCILSHCLQYLRSLVKTRWLMGTSYKSQCLVPAYFTLLVVWSCFTCCILRIYSFCEQQKFINYL